MLTPDEIQRMALRKYPVFLRSLVTGESIFPLRVRFGRPTTTDEFEELKRAVTDLAAGNFGYTIEWEEKDTRRWGRQKLPEQVRFDTEEQFVAALGKEHEVDTFRKNLALTRLRLPQLDGWLASHVKWVTDFGAVWDGMLAVAEYFLQQPRPGLYVRELPIQVHTKFIGENRAVLSSMLTELLPESARAEADTFDERFGLKSCEPLIRFRTLDAGLLTKLGLSHEEMGLPLSIFRKLPAAGVGVVITENLMNFETLPKIEGALAIFGGGNAAELLITVDWLLDCSVLYWGDIDEHGFHILSRLRHKFPGIQSIMMDAETLKEFQGLAGKGEHAGRPPTNLTAPENDACAEIARKNLRIEQEKIPHAYALKVLAKALAPLGLVMSPVFEDRGHSTSGG
ncbi:MAG: Wadjet anti-phage system protein JetD domain-containing protein [Limisphaerales bacterium]